VFIIICRFVTDIPGATDVNYGKNNYMVSHLKHDIIYIGLSICHAVAYILRRPQIDIVMPLPGLGPFTFLKYFVISLLFFLYSSKSFLLSTA
jgi:hypothetical protein